jgi:hypothetical protein
VKTKKTDVDLSRVHELNLLENGVDFIRSGIETFFLEDTPDPVAHKYAVLHLFSGVQLLLKERLRREHASLVFERVEEAAAPSARTITFDQSVLRLRACAGIKLSVQADKRLRTAKRIRDSLEHFKLELNLKQTQTVIGQLAEFSYEFMREHLDEELEQHLRPEAWRRVQSLRAIAEKLEKEALKLRRERIRRYKSLSAADREALKARCVYHPKDNPDAPDLFYCPECSEESVAVVEDGIAVCTNKKCEAVIEFERCFRCGNPAWNGGAFCDLCDEYIEYQ